MSSTGGYDIIVGAHAHTPLTLDQYRAGLAALVLQCHRVWEKRERRAGDAPVGGSTCTPGAPGV
jgi:hypothetical protein